MAQASRPFPQAAWQNGGWRGDGGPALSLLPRGPSAKGGPPGRGRREVWPSCSLAGPFAGCWRRVRAHAPRLAAAMAGMRRGAVNQRCL
jgi:hypothetical protein